MTVMAVYFDPSAINKDDSNADCAARWRAVPLMPGLWILRTEESTRAVFDDVAKTLSAGAQLLVAELDNPVRQNIARAEGLIGYAVPDRRKST